MRPAVAPICSQPRSGRLGSQQPGASAATVVAVSAISCTDPLSGPQGSRGRREVRATALLRRAVVKLPPWLRHFSLPAEQCSGKIKLYLYDIRRCNPTSEEVSGRFQRPAPSLPRAGNEVV